MVRRFDGRKNLFPNGVKLVCTVRKYMSSTVRNVIDPLATLTTVRSSESLRSECSDGVPVTLRAFDPYRRDNGERILFIFGGGEGECWTSGTACKIVGRVRSGTRSNRAAGRRRLVAGPPVRRDRSRVNVVFYYAPPYRCPWTKTRRYLHGRPLDGRGCGYGAV